MIYDWLINPFVEFEFMRRALVGVFALAISGSPLGIFLILRRMSLTGDAMAHAILPGAALGYLIAGFSLPAMTAGGMAAGLAVALLAGVVARLTSLREDASLAGFYLVSLALGVTIVSLRGSNIDLLHVLFGSVLALDNATMLLLAGISSLTLVTLALIYRALALETLDPGFLSSVSALGAPVQAIFLGLVVLNLVGGFHALGTLLAVGIIILPAASARLWSANITRMTGLSIVFGMISGFAGLLISYHYGLPSGPIIILMTGVIYAVSLLFGRAGGMLRHSLSTRRHLEA
ncbi:MAG: metal ABC transporter permease [Alphaproteobacteria bacterium]|nr:metal ABC transporter permease [Alphaproteobacteria bacterium]